MSKVILCLCVVLMIIFSCSGQTRECFQCDLGFWDMCYVTKTNCSAGEQCFVGIGVAGSVLKIKMMGCLAKADCNKTTILNFPANQTVYKMTKNCCDEDYCNGGTEVLKSSVTLGLLVFGTAQMMGLTL